jgi:hypothetical protein
MELFPINTSDLLEVCLDLLLSHTWLMTGQAILGRPTLETNHRQRPSIQT